MVIVIVDSLERGYFMSRLAQALRSEETFIFVTGEPLAFLRFRAQGYRAIYVKRSVHRSAKEESRVAQAVRIDLAIEVLNGRINQEIAAQDGLAIERTLTMLIEANRIDRCVVWNGQQLMGRITTHVCQRYAVPMAYLEMSNLPNKLFVDSSGVNALSTISRKPALIDGLSLPDRVLHEQWLREYEAYKAKPIPQSKTRPGRKLASSINYAIKIASRGVARISLRSSTIRNSAVLSMPGSTLNIADLSCLSYVFLPLQVTADTQIQLHSDVDNFGAIREGVEIAKRDSLKLIVKIHPAESDASAIRKVLQLQQELGFSIVSLPTVPLIKHARIVLTINSTVGLEALMYGKPIKTLGRNFYGQFDQDRLLKYIHSFLVDGIDYFGSGPISAAAARKVLMRS